VTTFAGKARAQGFHDGTGTDAQFSYPSHLSLNGLGDLFVSDSFNNAIRRVETKDAAATTVIGSPDHPGFLAGPLPAQIGRPLALALTWDGGLALVTENAVLLAH
jgi:hypothetical protein